MAHTIPPTIELPSAQRTALARLLGKLRSECKPGDRLPPIADLAGELRVGQGSVAQAVRDLARQGVLISRPRLGTFVANMPAGHEPTQSRLAGKTIAIINAQDSDGMVRRMGVTLERALADDGATVRFVSKAFNDIHKVHEIDADAAVIINPNSYPDITIESNQQLLILQTAAESPVAPGTQYDEVTVDQQDAVSLAGQHLRAIGCKSACFLGVHRGDDARTITFTSQVRLEAFERGWGAGIAASHLFVRKSYGESWGARMVAQYMALKQKPDAIFGASDELAVGFIKGALALGLEPSRDYQIIGFDGQQRGRDLLEGPLTTIQAPAELMAKRGAELLTDRLLNPDQPTRRLQLGCTLFKGRTTRTA